MFKPVVLTEEQQALSCSAAVYRNPLNFIQTNEGGGEVPTLSVRFRKRWQPGSTLRVRFLNGSSRQKARAAELIVSWSAFANIRFQFVTFGDTDVRVAFGDSSAWAYIGTDATLIDPTQPTVSLGSLQDDTDDVEFARVVLHQFGHVLGCEDEILQPDSPVDIDADAVRRLYPTWSEQEVASLLEKRSPDYGAEHTAFDANSIMSDTVPASLDKHGHGLTGGSKLSHHDKMLIGRMYPFQIPGISVDGRQFGDTFEENAKEYLLKLVVKQPGVIELKTSLQGGSISLYSENYLVAMQPQQIEATVDVGVYRVVLRRSWNQRAFFTVKATPKSNA